MENNQKSKVVRIDTELIDELNRYNIDINKAIKELLQIVTKSVTNAKLTDSNFLKDQFNTRKTAANSNFK